MTKPLPFTPSDIERAKFRVPMSAIVGRRVKLKRAGHEFVGLCPFHEERTPSFRINDTKGLYNCFGCGAGGDAIAFLIQAEGLTFSQAVFRLLGDAEWPESVPIDRKAAARREKSDRAAAILSAQAEWHETRGIIGTPAEIYLRSRGIEGPLPSTVRFGRVPLWRNKETGASGKRCPALILGAQDRGGKIVGVQHIFLTEDGRKAPMRNPKLSLGQLRGSAVRLGPPARRIILVEGPEDGMTIFKKPARFPVWITTGTGMMPFVDLPDEVEHITLAGDNNAAGRAAVEKSTITYQAQGRTVDSIFPSPIFEDFNDEHLGIANN